MRPSFIQLCIRLLAGLWLASSPVWASTYAVVCGVSQYGSQSLHYSDDDARFFYNYLIQGDGPGVSSANVTLLLEAQATRAGILNAMKAQFSKAKPSDVIIFFFSGHGAQGQFINYGVVSGGAILTHGDVKAAMRSSQAGTKICFADACFAGGLLPPNHSAEAGADPDVVFQQQTPSQFDPNVMVFMASRSQEKSKENMRLKQGSFTYYLINGLLGQADASSDKKVNVEELFAYVSKNVIDDTDGQQHPTLTGSFNRKQVLVAIP